MIPGSRPGQVSAEVLPRFRGYEGRSDPLPADAECSQFGTVSDRAYRQAVSRLSWLSYSPSGFSPDRRPSHGPVTAVAGRELPTPARLNEPHETSTRSAAERLWSEPPGRDFHPLERLRPRRESRSFPVAPLLRNLVNLSDRTSGLLSPHLLPYKGSMRGEDYADEPPSNRTSHSHGIRLYGSQHHCGWLNAAPLAEVVSLSLPGGAAHLSDVSNAPRLRR